MQASATKTEAQASLKQPSTMETTQPTMIQTSSYHRNQFNNPNRFSFGGWWLGLAFEPVEVVLDRERGQSGRERTKE